MVGKSSFAALGCISTLITVGFLTVSVKCEPKLKMLHVVFRHGEKTPHKEFQNYPNDPYGNYSFYPIGNGGLTNEGKMREYKIGKMLRERYDHFFGPVYWPDDIYARSTCYPRARMSLQLVLAALFPPVGQQIWNNNLPWQPALTFCEPVDTDYLFFPQQCALNKIEYKKFIAQEDTQRLINEHKTTLDYLTENSGKPITTTHDVYYLYNLLREERMQNLVLPEWTSKVFPEPMKNITILDFDLISGTTRLKRLGGGIMLRQITEDIKDLCNKTLSPPGRKAFLFSGHEDNVARMARTLGTNDPLLPPYGSAIIFETLQDEEKEDCYFVRVLLWTGSASEEIKAQKIPGCSELCPVGDFLRILKDVIADEYEYQCCTKSKNSKKNSAASHLSSNNDNNNINIPLSTSLSIIFTILSIICNVN